jgi:hypothetical protein
MTYPFIPIGLIAIFIAYILYLLFIKKDVNKLKAVLYPGLFFIAIWVVIYYFLLRQFIFVNLLFTQNKYV